MQTATEDNTKELGYKKPLKGALVTDVEQDSEAYEEGLRAGMIITEIRARP